MNSEQDILRRLQWFRFMLAVTAIGILYGLVKAVNYNVTKMLDGLSIDWPHSLIYSLGSSLVWVLLAPVILYTTLRIYYSTPGVTGMILKHSGTGIISAILHAFLFLSLNYTINVQFDLWRIPEVAYSDYLIDSLPNLVLDSFLFYGILVGLLTAYILYKKNKLESTARSRLETDLNRSRIDNLKYQLQPHFLFNSLQTISNLVHEDVHLADHAIVNLSDLLRLSLNQLDQDLITIQEEIETVQKYLEFQKIRFEGLIGYSIELDPSLFGVKIPAMVLQPLVENSIVHGCEKNGQPIEITINVKRLQNTIQFSVTDNGSGLTSDSDPNRTSSGLTNVKNRLKYFYGAEYTLLLVERKQGVQVIITVPDTI